MNVKRVFFDTNILIYAHDLDAGKKHEIAAGLVLQAWEGEWTPIISIQVLQEFLVNIQKKVRTGDIDYHALVNDYLVWRVVEHDTPLFQKGLVIMKKYQLSLWDSMILSAAARAKVEELWTEDLNTGQVYEGVMAVNPLLPASAD